jgi:serine phosphatase RsbU (regulator of sigma subunit)/pSer/pThr/pTyr-binding forkhead associated (FHA) protein
MGSNPATAEIRKMVEELVVYGLEGGSKIVSLAGGSVSLGRAASNDLSYPDDSGLSRQHFIIERVGSDFVLKDLGSKNGTELNSQRVSGSSVLRPGDRIKAGRLTIEYRKGDSKPTNQTVLFVETPQTDTSSGTVIATSLQAVLGTQESKRVTTQSPNIAGNRTVDYLIRAGQELAAHRPLPELFPLILDLSLQAVQASRGVLLTCTGGELVVQASTGENFQISSGVRDRVLKDKASLLVVDALADADFAERKSIVQHSVRSMIAAPLQTEDAVIGLLYVDLTNLTRFFTRDDLNLLTVMANIAAIRIQHAHLIEVEAAERVHSRELAQAAEIQRGLLPSAPPVVAGLELAGYNLQCRTVGGDYFDYLPFGDGLALVVGDVAGKGMPAALLMASLQAHTQAITELGGELGGDPASVVAKLNRAITRCTPGNRFVTFFMAVFDPKASTLTYCNAGHNPPLLIRSDGSVERLEVGGTVLGLFAGAVFQDETIRFDPGDFLILYSDGVVEACSANGDEEFGEERLLKIASENGSLDVPRVSERVIEALRAWSGDGSFADDVTVVLARRTAAG